MFLGSEEIDAFLKVRQYAVSGKTLMCLADAAAELEEDSAREEARRLMSDRYVDHLQDEIQAMQTAGDALASAATAILGPDQRQLIRMWDESKRHGEPERHHEP